MVTEKIEIMDVRTSNLKAMRVKIVLSMLNVTMSQ